MMVPATSDKRTKREFFKKKGLERQVKLATQLSNGNFEEKEVSMTSPVPFSMATDRDEKSLQSSYEMIKQQDNASGEEAVKKYDEVIEMNVGESIGDALDSYNQAMLENGEMISLEKMIIAENEGAEKIDRTQVSQQSQEMGSLSPWQNKATDWGKKYDQIEDARRMDKHEANKKIITKRRDGRRAVKERMLNDPEI